MVIAIGFFGYDKLRSDIAVFFWVLVKSFNVVLQNLKHESFPIVGIQKAISFCSIAMYMYLLIVSILYN